VVSVDTQNVQLTAPLANSFGQAVFSPDGSKYLTLNYGGEAAVDDVWVYFFDFDRCTGLLSGQKEWYYSDFCWSGGAAISKNSRFAYVSTSERIYQFDLWEEEPEQTFVQYRDDFVDLYPLAFNTLQLAPDGKIYGAAGTSSTYYLDVIDFPDKKGEACQIRQHGIQLPAIYNNGIPNHPNYRLGPLDGSPCDTLGLDNVPVALFRYDQDTLDYLTVEFTDLSHYEPAVWSWDFGDNTASSDASLVHNFPSSGLYEVCLTVSNQYGQDTFCQTLNLGTVATGEKKPQVDIHVFPNPCREMVNFTVTDYLPKDASATFYDAVGRPVLKVKLVSGWNSLSLGSLPAGVYFYEVWEGGVRLKSGKVVKVG
jgi:hypothetical protein